MVAKNFRFLYKYFGDTQKSLADMFDVTQSTISDYVNGTKIIPLAVLQKISIRYGVSMDDLSKKDLALEFDLPHTIGIKDVENIGESVLPILSSNIAKNNDNFNRAYNILMDISQLEKMEALYGKISVLEHAISLFQKAWDESHSYVAISNSLHTIFFIYMLYGEKGIDIGQKLINKGSVDLFKMEDVILRDPKKIKKGNIYEKKRKEFFDKYEDLVYDNIKLLKSNINFSELGDYYSAMCYFFEFVDDCIESELCFKIGIHMLLQLYRLGNKYAEKVIDAIP